MVAAKLSSGELPGEGSEQGAEGGGWEDLKGQRQVLRWQDAWGVRCVMDVTGSRAASARSVATCRPCVFAMERGANWPGVGRTSVGGGRRALWGLGAGQGGRTVTGRRRGAQR